MPIGIDPQWRARGEAKGRLQQGGAHSPGRPEGHKGGTGIQQLGGPAPQARGGGGQVAAMALGWRHRHG